MVFNANDTISGDVRRFVYVLRRQEKRVINTLLQPLHPLITLLRNEALRF